MIAAEQGLAEAQYNLAVMCSRGEGVEQNYKKAVEWFRRAKGKNRTVYLRFGNVNSILIC